jgi:Arylsulfotransferase (ASST)
VASPSTQIAFRGMAIGKLGTITVTGSHSGRHAGRMMADSDGRGGSFIPSSPFTAGETVTVVTKQHIVGGSHGTFHFTVAQPAGPIYPAPRPTIARVAGDVEKFHSRPNLLPPAVRVTLNSPHTAPGDIMLTPQHGPLQWGAMIIGPGGGLIWWDPLPGNETAGNLQVQRYQGKPVLTWWQGQVGAGFGFGEDMIDSTSYSTVAVVHATNGLQADIHEFQLTPQGTALITAYYLVHWDESSVHGPSRGIVADAVVQEIDIRTGLVEFQWDSLDHVPLTDSYVSAPKSPGSPYDYFHLNSIQQDDDGNLVISSRNTFAAYKLNRSTGAIMWRLGGKESTFSFGPDARFAFQHDVRVRAQNDQFVTIFDDGAGYQSRGLKLELDLKKKTAIKVADYEHIPPLVANVEGNDQQLPNYDDFIGWGNNPNFSEFTEAGEMIFDAHFVSHNITYRAYRYPWNAQPHTKPAIALSRGGNGVSTVYASWNGATDVAAWRLLAGSSPAHLSAVDVASSQGFETAISIHGEQSYFAVQPLGSRHQTLATSRPVGSTRSRLSIFGHTAFVPANGIAGLQVGCFSIQTCKLTAVLKAGNKTVATTNPESIGAGDGGLVFFKLNSTGRSLLGKASNHQLTVTASVRNTDGATTTGTVNLLPYHTTGTVKTNVQQSPSLRILVRSAFIPPTGLAGVFVQCTTSQPCLPSTTVSVGNTTVATTGPEFIGGQDCGTLFFQLAAQGDAMLAHADGNQLTARLTIKNGHDTATAQIALVRF